MTDSFISNYYEQLNGFGSLHDNHASILLYHGVTRVQSDGIRNFSKKHVTSDEFASDPFAYLKKYCSVHLWMNLFGSFSNERVPLRTQL